MTLYTFAFACTCVALAAHGGTVSVEFGVPYNLEQKLETRFQTISTTVEVPYKPSFFSSTPSDRFLKKATEDISHESKMKVWKKFLAQEKSARVLQKTREMDARIEDLVNDVSITHSVAVEDQMIVFTIRGKVNRNLVSQIAGYQPSAADLEKARVMGKNKALERYISKLDSSKIRKVESSRDLIFSRMDDLVYEIGVRDFAAIPEQSLIQYRVKASIDDNLFNQILFSDVEINETGEGALFGFLVLPRIQESVEQFGDTIKERTSEKSGVVSESGRDEMIADEGETLSESTSERMKAKIAHSSARTSSKIRQSQKTLWRVADATAIDAQINKHFTNHGYETIDFNDIMDACGGDEFSADVVRDDLLESKSGTLSRNVNRNLSGVVKACDVPLFGVGVINIDSIMEDRNSGGISAGVVVNIQVKDYSRRLPKKVASVGPVRFKGLGSTEDEAIDAALVRAASEASDLILSQLKTKRIR